MARRETEASLLAAAASGDRESFGRIYLAHKDDLLAVAASVLGDRGAAEDVVHDVFVSFARRMGQLRLRGRLKNYLLVSCVNRARQLLRRRTREPFPGGALDDPPSGAAAPDQLTQIADETARVAAALASLPPKQREVVALRIHGQLKFREIAALLAVSINTAKSRYRYALDTLRARLAEKGDHS